MIYDWNDVNDKIVKWKNFCLCKWISIETEMNIQNKLAVQIVSMMKLLCLDGWMKNEWCGCRRNKIRFKFSQIFRMDKKISQTRIGGSMDNNRWMKLFFYSSWQHDRYNKNFRYLQNTSTHLSHVETQVTDYFSETLFGQTNWQQQMMKMRDDDYFFVKWVKRKSWSNYIMWLPDVYNAVLINSQNN